MKNQIVRQFVDAIAAGIPVEDFDVLCQMAVAGEMGWGQNSYNWLAEDGAA